MLFTLFEKKVKDDLRADLRAKEATYILLAYLLESHGALRGAHVFGTFVHFHVLYTILRPAINCPDDELF